MSNVQQLLESAAGSWKNLQSDAAKLSNKWNKTGLLEGLVEVDKNNMSILLENQAKQLVIESNQITSNSGYTVGTTGENWAGIALPLVRKVFGTIVAKEFCRPCQGQQAHDRKWITAGCPPGTFNRAAAARPATAASSAAAKASNAQVLGL